MTAGNTITIHPVTGLGEIGEGAALGPLIADAIDLRDGDVLVVASKIVAKAEGMQRQPEPGESVAAARQRLTLQEEVLTQTPVVTVVRTADGLVCANAGIDASNLPSGGLLLLPEDCDASAAGLRASLTEVADVGVIVADTFGRAWREGQTDVALGVAGLPAMRDERGRADRNGRPLQVTLIALADQIAGAADLVRDKSAGVPVVVVRGLDHLVGGGGVGADLIRPAETDLFPHGRGWLARRLATGQGAAVRRGLPTPWECRLVARAAGVDEAKADDDGVTLRFTAATGLAAARAECCLLDLGYEVAVHPRAGRYTVVVAATGQ